MFPKDHLPAILKRLFLHRGYFKILFLDSDGIRYVQRRQLFRDAACQGCFAYAVCVDPAYFVL